ncbi:ribosome assembly RNA-binding protein YhbY [Gehongia tenuis]|uniref:Ribosome assembly RNA-binding protein YhbY n=1 Tax=Gehongia tenuis TaxID=2763655 RepID=A0A926D628_9FIRM|nr:ribosome assembly RNA-binding protein YhbY [Gehongia tenuis]MBC8532388.1 ribosome assembly RNA-binding protein YhbY [Gehongia tenuis]
MTSKERSYLRGLANDLEPIVHVGKGGIGENMVRQVDDALEARELIKGTVLQSSDVSAREVCDELCDAVGAEPVQVIGSRFVLYRKSKDHQRLFLDKVASATKPLKSPKAPRPRSKRPTTR